MERNQRIVNAEALVELLKTEALDFTDSAHSWILDCPICSKHKWAIRKSDGYSKCYRCNDDFKGWADYTLSIATKRTRRELAQLLYGVVVPVGLIDEEPSERWIDYWDESGSGSNESSNVWTWPSELLPHPDHHALDSVFGAPGLAYLEKRGVSLEIAKQYGVTYNTVQERVVFPIMVDGVLRGWQGRLIHSGKYKDRKGNQQELPKALTEGEVGGKILMFQDRLKGAEHGIITEGPFDAIKCHLCGGGNTATMGKGVSSIQLDIYVRYYGLRKLYLGLDDDAAEDTMRIVYELGWKDDVKTYRITPAPGREDLGEGTLEENLEQFRTAKLIKPGHQITYFKEPQLFQQCKTNTSIGDRRASWRRGPGRQGAER